MRIVFMGTPDFALPSLRALAAVHEVALVVTRPDAVRGRGRALVPSPVKAAALELGLEVYEANRVTDALVERVRTLRPDVICVAAYGALLPDTLLEIPAAGVVNVHASLLPKGRGAAPVQRALLEGETVVGVSIMRIVSRMDAGPYCAQACLEVGEKGCAEVMAALAELGAQELVSALVRVRDGSAVWTEQDEAAATYVAKVQKDEMLLDPEDGVLPNRRRVQASLDAAPARALVANKGVRILDARVQGPDLAPGAVRVQKGHVWLGCADGSLEVLRVKPDGRREMDATAWASGLRGELTWRRA